MIKKRDQWYVRPMSGVRIPTNGIGRRDYHQTRNNHGNWSHKEPDIAYLTYP